MGGGGYEILDVGCACGGLSKALAEKYKPKKYNGIDINEDMIEFAKKNNKLDFPTEFKCCDILNADVKKKYDIVISLGCVDWNIETKEMLKRCWNKVKDGGTFIMSVRLTTEESVMDINKGYQYINFSEINKGEIANYVVLNLKDLLSLFYQCGIKPNGEIYGYWGEPASTAVIPYERLCFSVLYLKKEKENMNERMIINLPTDMFCKKRG